MTLIIGVIDCFIVFLRLLKINIDRLASFYQSKRLAGLVYSFIETKNKKSVDFAKRPLSHR